MAAAADGSRKGGCPVLAGRVAPGGASGAPPSRPPGSRHDHPAGRGFTGALRRRDQAS